MNERQAPRISLVVAVYKGEFLTRLLESIQAQTVTDWECILVDDESPDDSGRICDEWAAKDERFVAIHKKNGGASSARNAGLAVARGEYVVIPDCDDALNPHTLEYALQMQRENPEAFVIWEYTGQWQAFLNGKDQPLAYTCYPRRMVDRLLVRRNLYFTAWNKLFSRKALQEHGIWFDERIRPDKDQYRIDPDGQWYGEDRDFVDRYMKAVFAQKGQELLIAYASNDLYYYDCSNTDAITRHIEKRVAKENEQMLDEENSGLAVEGSGKAYCEQMLREYEEDMQVEAIFGPEIQKQKAFHFSFLRVMAYGAYCAQKQGEKLPKSLWKSEGVRHALEWCRVHRQYTPYYLPARWGMSGLLAKLYYLDAAHQRNYGRFDWLGYYLLGGNWAR